MMESKSLAETANSLTISAKAQLMMLGFSVESPARLRGSSGAEHVASLSAVRKDGKAILLDAYVSSQIVGEEEVVSTFAKAMDANSYKTYVLALPGATESARRLAQFYGLRLLEGKNPDEILASFGRESYLEPSNERFDLQLKAGPGVIVCYKCGYSWKTRAKSRYIPCPSCQSKLSPQKVAVLNQMGHRS